MGILDGIFGPGWSGSSRDDEVPCPSRQGHFTVLGTCRCDLCNNVVEPDGDWGDTRR